MTDNIYTIKKGEKYPILVKVKNSDEDKPIDLKNAQIRVQIKDELKDSFYVIEKIITTETDVYSTGRITNPQDGEFVFRFTDEDFEKLTEEIIYYITIWWEIKEENFAKVISSNCKDVLKLMVCIP